MAGDLGKRLGEAKSLDAAQLLDRSSLPFAKMSFEPDKALGIDKVRGSSMAPSADEEKLLRAHGFSISTSKTFPTFTYGYATLYAEHLPLYVSADSLLHAVHKSYDKILADLEAAVLKSEVSSMLDATRGRLGSAPPAWTSKELRADLDLFLAVGLALLTEKDVAPVAGADPKLVASLVESATRAEGMKKISLFGAPREVDFSQMKPRGHYERPDLASYFRAMMWFGRTDFRLTEVGKAGEVLNRRQVDAAMALAELIPAEARKSFERVDRVIGLFVGEHDSMTLPEIEAFSKDLGGRAAIGAMSDGDLQKKLVESGRGTARIASQLLEGGTGEVKTLPRIFQLFGQRYTVDSHVFSNVTYDRAGGGKIPRMMPSPLDAAFAAFKNDQAASLLAPELKRHPYAPDLAATRVLVDEHGPAYWDGSLYTRWVSMLRALSPSREELQDPKKAGLPAVATTEAWGRRVLGTQLASWAELRHDTLLYAKQSYTGMAACEFPDAYVDPYPAFFAALASYAEMGEKTITSLGTSLPSASGQLSRALEHFKLLHRVAKTLGGMAEKERAGQPFTAEQMAFINDAVTLKKENAGCVTITTSKGWYPSLIVGDPLEFDPTIADVHTQPTDAGGTVVGRVLHVATEKPRRMVVLADTCKGPRAYVGLVSAYAEKTTEQFRRMSDSEWSVEVQSAVAPVPGWMADLVAK